jgi:hypothetical protein
MHADKSVEGALESGMEVRFYDSGIRVHGFSYN